MGGALKFILGFLFSVIVAFVLSYVLARSLPGSFQDDEMKIVTQVNPSQLSLNEMAIEYLQGNWGTSWVHPDRRVLSLVTAALKSTFFLQLMGIFLIVFLSFVLSFLSLQSERIFQWVQNISVIGTAFPTLFIAPILVYLFSYKWHLLPLRYDDSLTGYLLPLFCLSFRPACFGVQILSQKWRETRLQDYFRTARAKGLSLPQAFWYHGFKNSALSYLNQMFQFVGQILSGAVLVESLFFVPGLGSLFVESLRNRDLPVLMATLFIFCLIYILTQISFEIIRRRMEPREGQLL